MALFAACQTTVNGRIVASQKDEPFPQMSPFVEEQIAKKLDEIPFLRGRQVVDACSSIAQVGPAAIPKLQIAAKDNDSMRRTFVMNVLGAIGDRRALPTLYDALDDREPAVRYEAARSCVRMGDWDSGMPVLIAGLSDSSLYSRTLCHDALRKHTNVDLGFNPKGPDAERKAAAEKWAQWWSGHQKATLSIHR
jgi:HEAT repeat protein